MLETRRAKRPRDKRRNPEYFMLTEDFFLPSRRSRFYSEVNFEFGCIDVIRHTAIVKQNSTAQSPDLITSLKPGFDFNWKE